MLANLDAIDWKSLRHAYGEASDVPKLIRALVSDHPGKREGALDALFSTIWHQGSVYSASPAAVPFLLELLEAEGQEDLPAILELLAHLATGTPDEDAEPAANPAVAAREAVSRGMPVYARQLVHSEPAVRVAAAYLLGLFAVEEARAPLAAAIEDDAEPAVRAVAAFALGCVADPTRADELRARLVDISEHPAVRLYAGLGLARGGAPIEGPQFAALAELVDDVDLFGQLDELHDNAARMSYGPVADGLLRLPAADRLRLAPALGRALEAVRGRDALGLATALLGLAFADAAVPAGASAAALGDVQREALVSLVRAPAAWRYANIATALGDIGLPAALTERATLAAWLGVDAADLAEDDDDDDDDEAGEGDDEEDAGVDVEAPEPDFDELDRIGRFVACLDGQDWREARQWFAFYQQMRGVARVEPPAIGRYEGAHANLEAGYWLYDRELSRSLGTCVPLEHIRLAVGRKDTDDQVALRIRVDDDCLDAVLAAIVRHQDRVTPTDFTALAIDLIGAAPEVLLETGRAQRARLGRAAGSA
ncbi:HEAT repeat domain-containing protein [Nannocystis bainbridge]|uniref:HEAT repeat domain-containing protein n=1 Tax=Nannocystis bainbridge TaxID=2995303 RepID=A0ABT5ECK2_9BACT|nr:HEAT repeat domain-containing protein [Nannocystis bainbridge]MDC0722628.1 HEAT repeat domain-containing protein [Nannocystis bainbridge]